MDIVIFIIVGHLFYKTFRENKNKIQHIYSKAVRCRVVAWMICCCDSKGRYIARMTKRYFCPTLYCGTNHWKSHAGFPSPPPDGDWLNLTLSPGRNISTKVMPLLTP